jgi:hypothetical protein
VLVAFYEDVMPAMSSRNKYADSDHPLIAPSTRDERFVLIPLYGKVPPNAIAHGSMTSVIGHLIDNRTMSEDRAQVQQLRADTAALIDLAKGLQSDVRVRRADDAKAQETKAHLAKLICGMDALASRVEQLEARQRIQARYDAEPLSLPPDIPLAPGTTEDDARISRGPPKPPPTVKEPDDDTPDIEDPEEIDDPDLDDPEDDPDE